MLDEKDKSWSYTVVEINKSVEKKKKNYELSLSPMLLVYFMTVSGGVIT